MRWMPTLLCARDHALPAAHQRIDAGRIAAARYERHRAAIDPPPGRATITAMPSLRMAWPSSIEATTLPPGESSSTIPCRLPPPSIFAHESDEGVGRLFADFALRRDHLWAVRAAAAGTHARRRESSSLRHARRRRRSAASAERNDDGLDQISSGRPSSSQQAQANSWTLEQPIPAASRSAVSSGPRAIWWAVTGSNRRPSRCKRDALPTELTARTDRAPAGF